MDGAKASAGQGRWVMPRPPLAKAGRLTLTNLDLNKLEFGLSPPLAGRVAVGSHQLSPSFLPKKEERELGMTAGLLLLALSLSRDARDLKKEFLFQELFQLP